MEQYCVSVLISNPKGLRKCFEETHQGSLNSVTIAVKNIKDKTNEYLTGIIDEEKKYKGQGLEHVEEKENAEESDVEIEDDYIDSKIKNELLSEQSSSDNVNKSDKRTKNSKRSKKKARH